MHGTPFPSCKRKFELVVARKLIIAAVCDIDVMICKHDSVQLCVNYGLFQSMQIHTMIL